MALLELLIRFTHLAQRKNFGNRDFQPPCRNQSDELSQHLGIGCLLATVGFDAIFLSCREIDNGVDPVASDSQLEGQLYISAAKGINKRIDLSAACGADPALHAISVGNRNHSVVFEPLLISLTGQTDHFGSCIPGQLHCNRPDSTRRTGNHNRIACLQVNSTDRGEGRCSGDEESASLLPRDVRRPGHKIAAVDHHKFGLAGSFMRESDDLVPRGKLRHSGTGLLNDAGKITALAGRKLCRLAFGEHTLEDVNLARINPRRLYLHSNLSGPWGGSWYVYNLQNFKSTIMIEFHGNRHRSVSCKRDDREAGQGADQ